MNDKWKNPMTIIALAVGVGVLGIVIALIVSVFMGGPADSLSEGTFAVLAAAIGAVAGFSVQTKNDPDDTTDEWDVIEDDTPITPVPLDWPEEDDAEWVDDNGDEYVEGDADAPDQSWIEDALKVEGGEKNA